MDRELKDIIKDAKSDDISAKFKVAKRYEEDGQYKGAFYWYLELAEANQVEAQIKIGDFYLQGKGVKEDHSKAFEWYSKAAKANSSEATLKLANLYKEGLGVEKDENQAFSLYCDGSELNNAEAKYNLGLMYRNGNGCLKDDEKAFYYFNEAANEGNINAKVNLGFCYCNGIGTSVDIDAGINLYKEAAKSGNAVALFNLGMCYKSGFGVEADIVEAINCFEEAGKYGHGRALSELADIYCNEENFKKKIGFAIDCYQRAINNGYLEASIKLANLYFQKNESQKAIQWLERTSESTEVQFALGKYYFEGQYIEKNYMRSLKYLSEAAKKSHPLAQYYMGLAYLNGYGVNQDEERAIECLKISSDNNCLESILLLVKIYEEMNDSTAIDYLQKAVDLNSGEAMYKLGYNYAHGKYVEKDIDKAIELYQKGANLNNAQAQCNLGLCYLNGIGLKKNLGFGVYWLERASKNNSSIASHNLGCCYENGIGVASNGYLAEKYYLKAANDGNVDSQLAIARIYKSKDVNQAIYWYNRAIVKKANEAYLGLADVYMSEINVDENKVKMYLNSVSNKDLPLYKELEEKFKIIINKRSEM